MPEVRPVAIGVPYPTLRQEGAAGRLGPAWTGFPQLVEREELGQAPLARRALDVCQVAVHGAFSIVCVVAQRIEPIRVLHKRAGLRKALPTRIWNKRALYSEADRDGQAFANCRGEDL